MKLKWRKCGHPLTPENITNVSARRPGGRCRLCRRAARARYNASEERRAVQARYRNSVKGQTVTYLTHMRWGRARQIQQQEGTA